ncbi:MAG: hypothetical protein JWN41_763, partial [Thermoleophilia bacterium]|nr:hypothetical protein [Thermoleophilia bacterium]
MSGHAVASRRRAIVLRRDRLSQGLLVFGVHRRLHNVDAIEPQVFRAERVVQHVGAQPWAVAICPAATGTVSHRNISGSTSMNDTLLVRAAGGAWELLEPRTALPDGGVAELLGDDVQTIVGAAHPVIVAACSPMFAAGAPDALCLDATGTVWIMQTALDGACDQLLGQLLGFAGALTGASYDELAAHCDRRGDTSLVDWMAERAGSAFDRATFEHDVTASLAAGRIRLVALVHAATPNLVQSFRYLTSAGALGELFELSSFGSDSVTAIRASRVDLHGTAPAHTPAAAEVASASPVRPTAIARRITAEEREAAAASADTQPRAGAMTGPADADGAAFVEAANRLTGAAHAALLGQLQTACTTCFDHVVYDGDQLPKISAGITLEGDTTTVMSVSADGKIVISFGDMGPVDPSWTVRAELCQGLERLLGSDLGDVREIGELNMSVDEHLMDATLMDALAGLLADTVESVHEEPRRAGA